MEAQNNQQYGVDEFLNAVNLLFHSNDKDMKVKANKFLVDFEKKDGSWDVAFQVISKDNLSEETYYNALNILKRKIKYDFGNFSENPGYIEKLLSFLESNIDKFKKFKQYILINYCDCVGKAFLFSGDKFKPMLQKFALKLYTQNTEIENLISLLLIFNFICDSGYDESMVIDDKSRNKIKENIREISGDVFQFIIFMINKLNTIEDKILKNFISNQILDTLNNYLYLDFDNNTILKFNNEYLPIIDFIFQISEENLEKHSDCICTLLSFPLNKGNMKTLANIIFSKILEFKDIFYKTVESLDEEQASFYIEVFTSMIKNNFDDIIKEKRYDFFQIIVDLIKKCPSKKIDVIGDFFRDFNDYLLYKMNYTIREVMESFKNIFIQFFLNLMNLTKYEDDVFSKLNLSKTKALASNDDYNNTEDYRYIAKEIIEDFIENYGFNFIFVEIIFPEFNKVILKIKENQKEISSWGKMENILYIFSCSIEYINENDPIDNVLILLYTIFDIPKEFIQITRIITDIVDHCPNYILSWNKELLTKCFKYLVNGLDNKLIAKYVSVSSKNLLMKNKKMMSELREELLVLYDIKVKNKLLESEKYLRMAEGIISVITFSDNDNFEAIKNRVITIMKSWVIYLQEAKTLLEKNNALSPEDTSKLSELLIILKSISRAAFEGLSEENKVIMYEILTEIWPIIIFILKKMSTNFDLVENIIQFIKVYMRELKYNFIKFIPEYVKCIIDGYKLSPISSYLYGFEILVTVFPWPKENEIKLILKNTFKELCKITLNSYIKKEFDLKLFAQIGEDFFGLLYRILRISPILFLESEEFDTLINASINYINTSQFQISKNIMIFLEYILQLPFMETFQKDITSAEKYLTIIQDKINNFSSLLCKKILDVYIEATLEQTAENVTDLLFCFIKYQKPLILNGMRAHLQDFPNDILTNKEKDNFLNLINNFDSKNQKEINKFIDNLKNRCISKQVRNRGQN